MLINHLKRESDMQMGLVAREQQDAVNVRRAGKNRPRLPLVRGAGRVLDGSARTQLDRAIVAISARRVILRVAVRQVRLLLTMRGS